MSVTEGASPRKSKRTGLYIGIGVIVLLIVAAAAFQEQLGYIVDLQVWDRSGPARAVEQFLRAAQRGDQKAATAYLQMEGVAPLVEKGRWRGYSLPVGIVTSELRLED